MPQWIHKSVDGMESLNKNFMYEIYITQYINMRIIWSRNPSFEIYSTEIVTYA